MKAKISFKQRTSLAIENMFNQEPVTLEIFFGYWNKPIGVSFGEPNIK